MVSDGSPRVATAARGAEKRPEESAHAWADADRELRGLSQCAVLIDLRVGCIDPDGIGDRQKIEKSL